MRQALFLSCRNVNSALGVGLLNWIPFFRFLDKFIIGPVGKTVMGFQFCRWREFGVKLFFGISMPYACSFWQFSSRFK
jgi:hypothetical protein